MITLKQLSESLNFETTSDLGITYQNRTIFKLFDVDEIADYLEHDTDYALSFSQLSQYSDEEILDEVDDRGLLDACSNLAIEKIVQSHRTGKLMISGENADALLEHLYDKANKVV
jgi:hypothetical protein